jgi:hypothetical protein
VTLTQVFVVIIGYWALNPGYGLACQIVPPNTLQVTFSCKDLPPGVSFQKGPPYEGSLATVQYLENRSDTRIFILSGNASLLQTQSAISPSLLFGAKKEYSALTLIHGGNESLFDEKIQQWKVRLVAMGEKSVPFRGLEVTPYLLAEHFSMSGVLDLKPAYEEPTKPVLVPKAMAFKIQIDRGLGIESWDCLATFAPNPRLLEEWESAHKRGCPKLGP